MEIRVQSSPRQETPAIVVAAHDALRTRCPFCHSELGASDRAYTCVSCRARHHEACWLEGGACAACRTPVFVGQARRERRRREWGSLFWLGLAFLLPIMGVGIYSKVRAYPGYKGHDANARSYSEFEQQRVEDNAAFDRSIRDAGYRDPRPSLGELIEKGAKGEAERLAEEGDARFMRFEVGAAYTLYTQSLEIQRDGVHALAGRAAVLTFQGDVPHAIEDLARAAALDAPRARAMFTHLAALGGETAEALARKAHVLARARLHDEAIAVADRLKQVDPTPAGLERRGALYVVAGRTTEGTALIRAAIEAGAGAPSSTSALDQEPVVRSARAEAWSDRASRQLSDRLAIELYTRALRINPGCPRALIGRASVYRRLGDHVAARNDLDALIELDPNDPASWLERSHAREEAGEIARARLDLETAILKGSLDEPERLRAELEAFDRRHPEAHR